MYKRRASPEKRNDKNKGMHAGTAPLDGTFTVFIFRKAFHRTAASAQTNHHTSYPSVHIHPSIYLLLLLFAASTLPSLLYVARRYGSPPALWALSALFSHSRLFHVYPLLLQQHKISNVHLVASHANSACVHEKREEMVDLCVCVSCAESIPTEQLCEYSVYWHRTTTTTVVVVIVDFVAFTLCLCLCALAVCLCALLCVLINFFWLLPFPLHSHAAEKRQRKTNVQRRRTNRRKI